MRIAYGDLIGGVSGDMFVAALLDLGLSLNKLRAELKKSRRSNSSFIRQKNPSTRSAPRNSRSFARKRNRRARGNRSET